MELTIDQHNNLVKLTKNNIPFMVTGRYSYQSDIEPSDIDLIILKKYMESVNNLFEQGDTKGSQQPDEPNQQRIIYKDKIDILYIEDEVRWEELVCFSRIVDGIRYTHPVHSMLSKIKMIMKTVPAKYKSSFKHGKDLEDYITNIFNTEQHNE